MENTKRRTPIFLIILVILLALAFGGLLWKYYQEQEKAELIQKELKIERNELESELRSMHGRYDSLKTSNDTLNIKLKAEQKKIERLLKIRASNIYKIRMYRDE